MKIGDRGGIGGRFSLKHFLIFILRLCTDFEPPMYTGTGQNVCVGVGGVLTYFSVLIWSKQGLWPWTGTGTKPNNIFV